MVMTPPQQHNMNQTIGFTDSIKYRNDIMNVFSSQKFMEAQETQKKQMIGTLIFRYVTNLVTEEFSPKITGMIIDLPMSDLNYSVSNFETLHVKVKSAVQLLVDTKNMEEIQARNLPISVQGAGVNMSSQPKAQQVFQAY